MSKRLIGHYLPNAEGIRRIMDTYTHAPHAYHSQTFPSGPGPVPGPADPACSDSAPPGLNVARVCAGGNCLLA